MRTISQRQTPRVRYTIVPLSAIIRKVNWDEEYRGHTASALQAVCVGRRPCCGRMHVTFWQMRAHLDLLLIHAMR